MATSPPRSIDGSIGSRIRVILGTNGYEWLVLLNHDDGNSTWQSQNWKNVPHPVARQLNNCVSKGRYCKTVDFAGQSWYVHGIKRDNTGSHSWWGGLDSTPSSAIKNKVAAISPSTVTIGEQYGEDSLCIITGSNGYHCINVDEDLSKRLKRIHNRRKSIKFVRLFGQGSYFIKDDEGTEWKGLSCHCGNELKKPGRTVNDLAVASDGSWLIVNSDSYIASTGVDKALCKELVNFYNQQRTRQRKRKDEINAYHDRIAREVAARAAAERQRQEREEQELRDKAAAEELARRLEEEEKQKAEDETKRLAREQVANRMEERLEKQLLEEKQSIAEMEKQLETMKEHLQSRKRSLQASLDSLSSNKRQKFNDNNASSDCKKEKVICVVCHDAETTRACVPCGHFCLCDECGPSLASSPDLGARLCPLCREPLQSTLKIFGLASD